VYAAAYGYDADFWVGAVHASNPLTRIGDIRDEIHRPIHMAYAILPHPRGTCPPIADVNTAQNALAGVLHRIGRSVPPVSTADRRLLRSVAETITISLFGAIGPRIMGFEEWLEGTSYTMVRKEQLRELRRRLCANPLDPTLGRVKAFIKREKFATFKNPRIICAREDPVKVILGPVFKSLEHMIFKRPCFIKHVPVAERARHIVGHFGNLEGYQLYVNDHTSFEVHAFTTMSELEGTVYRQYLPEEWHEYIASMLYKPQRITLRHFSATVCSRMSGEMNTSLGNGLCNYLSVMTILYVKYGPVVLESVRCIIEGDDGIFAIPSCMTLTEKDFERFGFVVKLEAVDSLGKAGFCSTYFSPDGKHAIVEPFKAIVGLGWSFNYRPSCTQTRLKDLCRSRALSWAVEYRGVPVLQAIGRRLLRETKLVNKIRGTIGTPASLGRRWMLYKKLTMQPTVMK